MKIFGSTLLQAARSVCASLGAFSIAFVNLITVFCIIIIIITTGIPVHHWCQTIDTKGSDASSPSEVILGNYETFRKK